MVKSTELTLESRSEGDTMYRKRLIVCVFGGIVAAGFCLAGRQILFGAPEITWNTIAYTMANRLLLGFTVALSGWRINHLAHGAILGFIVSFSVSLGFLFSNPLEFAAYTSAGVLYGFLIEWFSTDIFKAPMRAG
jgi:hypothetical protein